MVFALHFTSRLHIAIMALGLAFRPEPVRMPPVFHGIRYGVASSRVHQRLVRKLAFAPVFAAMSLAGLVYMVLLGWGLASSQGNSATVPETDTALNASGSTSSAIHPQFPDSMRFQHNRIGNDSNSTIRKRFPL